MVTLCYNRNIPFSSKKIWGAKIFVISMKGHVGSNYTAMPCNFLFTRNCYHAIEEAGHFHENFVHQKIGSYTVIVVICFQRLVIACLVGRVLLFCLAGLVKSRYTPRIVQPCLSRLKKGWISEDV